MTTPQVARVPQAAASKTNGNGHAHVQRPPYEWDALPSELLAQGLFVLYRNMPEAGKKDRKVPYQPKNPTLPAKNNDPATGSDFALARAAFHTQPTFDGINFFTCPQFTAVDLDLCVTDGQISAEAKAVIAALPNTYWELSPSRSGVHGIFRSAVSALQNISEGRSLGGQKVEVYARGHFMSITGWVKNDAPIAELKPEHIEKYRVKNSRPIPSPTDGEATKIPQGTRTAALLRLAGKMFSAGCGPTAIESALRDLGEKCDPPVDEKKIQSIMKSAAKWPMTSQVDLLSGERQDVGNADRLLRYGQGDYGYVAVARRWTVYDGTSWPVEDREQEAIRTQAHEMVRALKHQIVDSQSKQTPEEHEAWLKFAASSLDSSRISHMLREAQPYAVLRIADLDRDPLLVNFLNGTWEAQTGKLREHRRDDFITAIIPYEYQPKAKCPKWEKFVRETFGDDKELTEFVQRALGYSLTGTTSEKCIFLANGETNTGKTTLLATVRTLLADYAGQIKVESLMKERKGPLDANAQSDLADLRGKRFVMTSETGQGQRLREELVKLLSQGQSKYKAVRKYENPFEFPETWKIWMDCNHLPVVKGTDDAIWERLIVVPFRHAVTKRKQNQKLSQQLIAREAKGIVAWMVEGLKAWTKEGLRLPAGMRQERKEWREESDDLNQWIEECCVKATDAKTKSTELYSSYKVWRATSGLFEESTQLFARKMKEHGFNKKEYGHDKAVYWLGVGKRAR